MNSIKERETLAVSRFSEIKTIIVSLVQALKHMASGSPARLEVEVVGERSEGRRQWKRSRTGLGVEK